MLDELTPLLLVLLAGMWLTPSGPGRQNENSERIDGGSKLMLTSPDTAYVMAAAQNSVGEVSLGKLAAAKASDPDVRSFGKQMVDDYVKGGDQLSAIAEQQSMTLPNVMSVGDQMTFDRLTKLSGSAFDKAYMDRMLKDQEAELKACRKEATTGKNTNTKGFASQLLPTLQDHLDRVRMIQSKVRISR